MSQLRFNGDWPLWTGVLAALALAAVAWFWYRRETRRRTDWLSWLLPLLRSGAVFLLVLMLTGPLLHHRKVVGQLARVLLLVDGSASMGVKDLSLEPHRKLMALEQLGWLGGSSGIDPELRAAALAAERARRLLGGVPAAVGREELQRLAAGAAQEAGTAVERLGRVASGTWPEAAAQRQRLVNEFATPLRELARRAATEERTRLAADAMSLSEAANAWAGTLRRALDEHASRASQRTGADARRLDRFDSLNRWERAEALLLAGRAPLLPELAIRHQVELRALNGPRAEALWFPGDPRRPDRTLPDRLGAVPTNDVTNLSDALRAALQEHRSGERLAVVLFSDGQHNDGSSPTETARMLGAAGAPVFTVSLGSTLPPADVAITGVTSPENVHYEDRVRGEVQLKDELPAGTQFTLRIECEGRLVWQQPVTSENRHRRSVGFDFPIKQLVEQGMDRAAQENLRFHSLPLAFKVTVAGMSTDSEAGNNSGAFSLRASRTRPKVLVLDGRPRWEFRFLRNMLERDEKWEVNSLLAGAGGEEKPWPRGAGAGQFPADRLGLFDYQLIVFGDVQHSMLRDEELGWINEYVAQRGGGVIFIDGRREQLATYVTTPLGPLLPVGWRGNAIVDQPLALRVVGRGSTLAPVSLVADPRANAALWAAFPAPRWTASTFAHPGTDVLLEFGLADRAIPALASRRYGAGRVIYASFDESWRWRYEQGDLLHARYWNQLVQWAMSLPYAVEDRFVSLDSGRLRYRQGESVRIRAAVRDANGRLQPQARPEAVLFLEGRRAGSIPLTPMGDTGTFEADSGILADGHYEMRLQIPGIPDSQLKAATRFEVRSEREGEMTELTANEALLQDIARLSGGAWCREEDASGLVDQLQPLSQGRVVESETLLWQSWWWFGAVILLLTVEWALRKRAGLL